MSLIAGVSSRSARTLIACTLGGALGFGTLGIALFGQFALPLARGLNASRDNVGFAFTCMTLGALVGAPVAGALIDRLGARWVIVASSVMMSAAFGLMAGAGSLSQIYVLYAVMAFAGAGTLVTGYSRPIVAQFVTHRGAALGVMLAAVGLAAALLPPLLVAVIEVHGVRGGYGLLAAIALVAALPAAVMLSSEDGRGERRPTETGPLRQAVRLAFAPTTAKLLAISFLLGAFSSGVWGQVVPILVGRGLSAGGAAWVMSGVALVLTGTRLLAGFAMDRVFAPYVGVAVLTPVVLAWLLLAGTTSPEAAIAAALLFGVGVGVEFDLFSFLTSKYVPHAVYSSFYGILYSVVTLGLATGPLLFAWSRSLLGMGEAGGLVAMAIATASAAALLITLPRYGSHTPATVPDAAPDPVAATSP